MISVNCTCSSFSCPGSCSCHICTSGLLGALANSPSSSDTACSPSKGFSHFLIRKDRSSSRSFAIPKTEGASEFPIGKESQSFQYEMIFPVPKKKGASSYLIVPHFRHLSTASRITAKHLPHFHLLHSYVFGILMLI